MGHTLPIFSSPARFQNEPGSAASFDGRTSTAAGGTCNAVSILYRGCKQRSNTIAHSGVPDNALLLLNPGFDRTRLTAACGHFSRQCGDACGKAVQGRTGDCGVRHLSLFVAWRRLVVQLTVAKSTYEGGGAPALHRNLTIFGRKRISMSRQPKRDLRRRQRRQRKVSYLKERLARTNDSDERRRLTAKIRKLSPTAPLPH